MRAPFLGIWFMLLASAPFVAAAPLSIKPDLVVATDGSGDFRTIHEAVQSIPRANRERRVVLVKDGVYVEKVRVDAPFVTLRGESRAGTRLEFAQAAAEWDKQPDKLGRATLNLSATADDFVLENLTVKNTHGVLGPHAFAVFGAADQTVIVDCDVLSHGADTLSLWRAGGGRYYHARLNVTGSVDFICPRGWCFMRDSTITQLNPGATAAIWHDGGRDVDKKFVLRNCRFDGPENWHLARRHHDAQFYLIDCAFSETMRDRAPYRVIYPLNGGTPTEADIKRNKDYDRTNVLGDRAYFFNSRKAGGDFAWHRDNLDQATGAPRPEQVTAAWTFAGTWDPERTTPPRIRSAGTSVGAAGGGEVIEVVFDEAVTVKGRPRVDFGGGKFGDYLAGSGTRELKFALPVGGGALEQSVRIDLNGGAIIATEAGATLRGADLTLPSSTP